MYYVCKTIEISGSHSLNLPYESKCTNLHGHNWVITIYCRTAELDPQGMVVDFTHIKQTIIETLDHRNLNDIFDFNPTAENIACWIQQQTPHCYRVDVKESSGNVAIYTIDDSLCDKP